MMLPSHLLAAALLALLASRAWRPWTRTQWGLALGFGVVIDLDHALQLPAYLATMGTGALAPGTMLEWGGAWQGFLHTPWALLLVVPFMLMHRSVIPLAFWGLHMVQDFVIARHVVVWGSPTEWVIVAALAAALAITWRYLPQRGGARNAVPAPAPTQG